VTYVYRAVFDLSKSSSLFRAGHSYKLKPVSHGEAPWSLVRQVILRGFSLLTPPLQHLKSTRNQDLLQLPFAIHATFPLFRSRRQANRWGIRSTRLCNVQKIHSVSGYAPDFMRSLRSRVEVCQGRWGRAEDLPRSMLHNSSRRTDCTNPAHLQCFSVAFCSKKVGFVSPLIGLDLSVHPIHSVKLLIGEPVISK